LTSGHQGHAATLRDYLHVVQRRKWIIATCVLFVPLAAFFFSVRQPKLYEAQAQVLLSAQNLAAQLTNTQSTGINLQPDRIAQTQAGVARVPAVAKRVLQRISGAGLSTDAFLGASSVTTSPNADLLTFSVTNHDPTLAQRLVSAYARQYTIYRRQLDTAAIQTALRSVNAKIKELVKADARGSALYAQLVDRQQTLATMDALQTANATVVKLPDSAAQVQPKPNRNAILGLLLGAVLGIGLAFLWEALDTRVRSAAEIGERLGLPLLARIPAPNRKLRGEDKLVMVEDPTGVQAEAFRMLRTNLDFATLGHEAQVIMVTSSVQQEGKSTTIANLAVALARAGKRVVLVDLDLRRPFVDRFFRLDGPGVTQVALGHVTLDQAMATFVMMDPRAASTNGSGHGNGSGNGGRNGRSKGHSVMLEVLPSGPIPPDPGEFVGTAALTEILEELRERADIVLIDAPPALNVGDAMTLSTKVDGIIVVTRMKTVRRQMLAELSRLLHGSPTAALGYIVTGADEEEGYGYGYGYGYDYYAKPYEQEKPRARSRS
jgi:Mrp family chromosome partitioning ATPase/capsular polysaccharide biosynthesis protein